MKYNPDKHHRRSIRLQGYDYTSAGAYFITICTHHRDCLFGDIVDGEMRLNRLGHVVRSRWLALPHHYSHIELDAFVVMPNHFHGILILTHPPGRGAAFGQPTPNPGRGAAFGREPSHPSPNKLPNATPHPIPTPEPGVAFAQPTPTAEPGAAFAQPTPTPEPGAAVAQPTPTPEPGVAFGREMVGDGQNGLPNAAPLRVGSMGEIPSGQPTPTAEPGVTFGQTPPIAEPGGIGGGNCS